MLVTSPYRYAELKKELDGNKRYYTSPSGEKLASVTTILSATKSEESKKGLADWRKGVGDKVADDILKTSTDLGSVMHKTIENYVLEKAKPQGPLLAKMMADSIIKNGLKNVDEVWGIEVELYFPKLYAGTTDMVGVYDGKPAIIDFKNSINAKTDEFLADYRCQLAAYALAHDRLFDTNIKTGVIMMATQSGNFSKWVIEGDEFEEAVDEWLDRLEQYFKEHK